MSDAVIDDKQLEGMLKSYADSYKSILGTIVGTIEEEVSKLSLPAVEKAKIVVKGIELCNDTAMKIAVTVEANRDNLLVKALDSNSQMIGMMAQGGLKIEETQFKIYYEALKKVLEKGGVTIQEAQAYFGK